MHETQFQLSLMPWQALLKALSLGYLLGLLGMALASMLWQALRPHLAAKLRAVVSSTLLLGAALLQALLAAMIWRGVVVYDIRMTTMHFHKLMHGEWSIAIGTAGLIVLAASLLIATWSYQRGHTRTGNELQLGSVGPLPLLGVQTVSTAALVGVFRPQIWVNPQWWDQLSAKQRELALAHELEHWRRGDNWRKLLLEWMALFFAVLPAARRWQPDFELDCELAVDAACQSRYGDPVYRDFLAATAAYLLSHIIAGDRPQASTFSPLGCSGMNLRLKALQQSGSGEGRPLAAFVIAAGWLVGLLPSLLLLSHPLSRCFLACYLGY
jgi:hypothetical protein